MRLLDGIVVRGIIYRATKKHISVKRFTDDTVPEKCFYNLIIFIGVLAKDKKPKNSKIRDISNNKYNILQTDSLFLFLNTINLTVQSLNQHVSNKEYRPRNRMTSFTNYRSSREWTGTH